MSSGIFFSVIAAGMTVPPHVEPLWNRSGTIMVYSEARVQVWRVFSIAIEENVRNLIREQVFQMTRAVSDLIPSGGTFRQFAPATEWLRARLTAPNATCQQMNRGPKLHSHA